MVWSNWQGAIWRGAGVMLLFWSGLAWTQTTTQKCADTTEPTMVVHENGKATRCRVLETWQLPDGRNAHLLEAIETKEKITIVSDAIPANGAMKPRAMPIRIFAWGPGTQTPPKGTPLPPHMRLDSGVVIQNELPRPGDAVVAEGPAPIIINESEPGPRVVNERTFLRTPNIFARLFTGRSAPRQESAQLIEFTEQKPIPLPANPVVQAQAPKSETQDIVISAKEPVNYVPAKIENAVSKPIAPMVVNGQGPSQAPAPAIVNPPMVVNEAPLPTPGIPGVPQPAPTPIVLPSTTNSATPTPAVKPISNPTSASTIKSGTDVRPLLSESSKTTETKKAWQPGERLSAWWQKPQKIETAKADPKIQVPADPVVVDPQPAKVTDPKMKKADDFLAHENKLAEKKIADKMEKVYKSPFSTAMTQTAPPETKKPETKPLAIPEKKDEKPAIAPVTAAPAMPPARDDIKPAVVENTEPKRDMFGSASADKVLPPGKTTVDSLQVKPDLVKLPPPPTPRRDDPLMAPDRVVTRTKTKMLPPVPSGMPALPDTTSSAKAWPPGAASVLAARSGLEGPVTYVPVPTVTVPQPINPPMPPAPQMPEAPQLNAYVNAFSAPPMPRGGPQGMMPQQGMMPAQAMMPYGQQPMPYGYPPPQAYAMNPYAQQPPMMQQPMPYGQPGMMPSQGPTVNYSRQYSGPMPPPNPYAPAQPAGYGYPAPMMPPQQQPIQQAGYQQTPSPQSVSQQIEQLVKVLRENAYPAQREWAAQMLAGYEWRVHPQIIPALLQSAAQDPAATVRAGCVACLGRSQAAVEPVFATLHQMRNDIDPRVRAEVEQAFVRLGQTPMAPQN